MSDQKSETSITGFWNSSIDAIDDVIDRIRRGRPVALTGEGRTFIFLAAESLSEAGLSAFRSITDAHSLRTGIVISSQRALTLNIAPKGKETLFVCDLDHWDTSIIRSISDPTHDLSYPLRGPFEVIENDSVTLGNAAVTLLKAAMRLPSAYGFYIEADKVAQISELRTIAPISADDVFAYQRENYSSIERIAHANVPLTYAEDSSVSIFRSRDGRDEFVAISIGNPEQTKNPLVRIHSECFTGDLLQSLKCDCGTQLHEGLKAIAHEGSGILIYLAQEGRGIGLAAKLKAYALQDIGFDTVEANLKLGYAIDERFYQPAAEILKTLGCRDIRLLTNNPEKVNALESAGIQVIERVKHSFPSNTHNEHYLKTKRLKTGHLI